MVKTFQALEKRRQQRASPDAPHSRLFPNGEKDEMYAQMKMLTDENRRRRGEQIELKGELGELRAELADAEEKRQRESAAADEKRQRDTAKLIQHMGEVRAIVQTFDERIERLEQAAP